MTSINGGNTPGGIQNIGPQQSSNETAQPQSVSPEDATAFAISMGSAGSGANNPSNLPSSPPTGSLPAGPAGPGPGGPTPPGDIPPTPTNEALYQFHELMTSYINEHGGPPPPDVMTQFFKESGMG